MTECPHGKKPYASKDAASKARRHLHTKKPMRSYRCRACGQWHITTTSRRQPRARKGYSIRGLRGTPAPDNLTPDTLAELARTMREGE